MSLLPADVVRPFLAPALVALLAISSGTGFGVAFGAFEDSMKQGLQASADAVLADKYGGDAAKAKAVVDKSWVYYKRAHLHTGALGAQALVITLLMAALTSSLAGGALRLRQAAAWASALGALGYGWFWCFAGRMAPSLGSTGAAKEALELLAVPSSGGVAVGVVLAVVAVVQALRARPV